MAARLNTLISLHGTTTESDNEELVRLGQGNNTDTTVTAFCLNEPWHHCFKNTSELIFQSAGGEKL